MLEAANERGHPLKGKSREKTPLHRKKPIFFARLLAIAPVQSRFHACSAPVTSVSLVPGQPTLIRTSHPSGSRLLCFRHL
jgi:hypothetical protein